MKINNIILVLRTRIILLSSFVIYFFCICHSGCFPIIPSQTGNESHETNTFQFFNEIVIKYDKMHENMGYKLIISSDLRFLIVPPPNMVFI